MRFVTVSVLWCLVVNAQDSSCTMLTSCGSTAGATLTFVSGASIAYTEPPVLYDLSVYVGTEKFVTIHKDGSVTKSEGLTDEQALPQVLRQFARYAQEKQNEAEERSRLAMNHLLTVLAPEKLPKNSEARYEYDLDFAIQAWRRALGVSHLGITRPHILIAGKGGCSEYAIACTIRGDIALDHADTPVDYPTIFMHEVGHLLGVPHIEGDALMDSAYQGKALTAPTPDSILLAKRRMAAKK